MREAVFSVSLSPSLFLTVCVCLSRPVARLRGGHWDYTLKIRCPWYSSALIRLNQALAVLAPQTAATSLCTSSLLLLICLFELLSVCPCMCVCVCVCSSPHTAGVMAYDKSNMWSNRGREKQNREMERNRWESWDWQRMWICWRWKLRTVNYREAKRQIKKRIKKEIDGKVNLPQFGFSKRGKESSGKTGREKRERESAVCLL